MKTELLHIFMIDFFKGWGVRQHSHDFYQIWYIIDGLASYYLDNQKVVIEGGDLIFLRPGTLHELPVMEDGLLRYVDIKFLIHDEELRQVCAQLPAQIKISEDFISDDLLKCREYWYEDSQYSQEISRLIFEAALLALLQKQQQLWDAVKSPRIRMSLKKNMEDIHGIAADIVHYIDNHYAEDFALENLAEALRYNKTYLCKLFKDATGMTIVDYLKYVRISRAYDLLCYTRNSMSCISQIVGFSSPHYFTRVFKKVCKMTPREVRELQRDSIQRDIRLHGNFNYRYYVDPKDMGASKAPPEESVPETSGEDV